MALFHANFFSQTLGIQSSANVMLPNDIKPGERLPVLYLLHGLSDDHTIWQRRTSLERYLESYRLAVVMPNGHRSFYTDMAHGEKYFTYMADELPQLMQGFFPIARERALNFVAGLSMGGYGAFKLALNRPQQYAAAASLSGALNMAGRDWESFGPLMETVFDSPEVLQGPPHNLLAVIKQLDAADCPALFQACGTEDFIYEENLIFRDAAKAAGLPLTYTEGSGSHEWSYWDALIQEVLSWLPL